MAWSVVGYEGVRAKGSHEAFQTGEVRPPCREDQACVEKLAVQLLGLVQIVGLTGKPVFDGSLVLGFFPLGNSHGTF
jgi:hypothetical protein